MMIFLRWQTWPSTACARLIMSLALVSGLAAPTTWAVGTTAGTAINNAASVSYEIGSVPVTEVSNTVTVTVAELIDLAVVLQSPQTPVDTGATNQELLFTLTNTGNGPETFALALDNALAGDDFDPVAAVTAIYFDTDGSGDLSSGDTPYSPGSNDPVLPADASIAILIVNDIPAGLTNGNLGQSALNATSVTGTGPAGTVFAGAGEGGVDAIIGNSTGTAGQAGEYVISMVTMAVVKSATVTDPFGGTTAIPGAVITYRIEITASGSSTATGAAVNDVIPTDTTYVAASLTLNSTSLTDAPDADAGQYLTATNSIDVQLGDLTSASGTQIVEFDVTIN